MTNIKPNILVAKCIIIKIGSSLLIEKKKFNKEKLNEIILDVYELKKKKIKVIIVASGAVALGSKYLNVQKKKKITISEKQALASCGQSLLMKNFISLFDKKKIKVAKIIITSSDTEDRERSLNARDTISVLLESDVIPIINENDSVSNEEIKFGDNDRLAARVAQISNADFLILLSDVNGLYDKNPKLHQTAQLIKRINKIDERLFKKLNDETNELGSGGMLTKVKAAQIASNSGCNTIISSGKIKRPLSKIIKGTNENCTWFIAKFYKNKNLFKNWLAGSLRVFGTVMIDDGAYNALKKGASLLPSGVISVKGKFRSGDLIEIVTKNKKVVARGIVSYNFKEIKLISGKKSSQIENILGYIGKEEIIHRDYMTFEKNFR